MYFILFNIYSNYVNVYITYLFKFGGYNSIYTRAYWHRCGTTRSSYGIYGLRYGFQMFYLFIYVVKSINPTLRSF